jgi:hypothetical protein
LENVKEKNRLEDLDMGERMVGVREQWWAFLNKVMNLMLEQTTEDILISAATVSFSRNICSMELLPC